MSANVRIPAIAESIRSRCRPTRRPRPRATASWRKGGGSTGDSMEGQGLSSHIRHSDRHRWSLRRRLDRPRKMHAGNPAPLRRSSMRCTSHPSPSPYPNSVPRIYRRGYDAELAFVSITDLYLMMTEEFDTI